MRHGEGVHNATGRYGVRDPLLTAKGEEQASQLREHETLAKCDLLVVSPMSRAVQTASIIFGKRPACRVVLTPLHSERCDAGCDEGRAKSQLAGSYPFIADWEGFASMPEDWMHTKTSDLHWRTARVPAFVAWVRAQKERHIVCVGHGAFFQQVSGKYMGNCEVTELFDADAAFDSVLTSSDPAVRQSAAERLGVMGRSLLGYMGNLEGLLSDGDSVVRKNAVKALGTIAEILPGFTERSALADRLSPLLRDVDSAVRHCACEAFITIGEAGARFAIQFLGFLEEPVGESPADVDFRQACIKALGQMLMGNRGLYERPDDGKRRRLARRTWTDKKPFVTKLVEFLDADDCGYRYAAVESLGYMGSASSDFVKQISRRLGDSDVDVKQITLWTLGKIGSAAGAYVKSMARLLNGPDTEQLRWWALDAFGNMGEVALPLAGRIVDILHTSSVAEERAAAATALGKIGALRFTNDLANLLRHDDPNIREAAVMAFGSFGWSARQFAPMVRPLLTDADPDIQRSAELSLKRMAASG